MGDGQLVTPAAGWPGWTEDCVVEAGSIVRGSHSRSFPPSAGDQPGLAYRMAVTCARLRASPS